MNSTDTKQIMTEVLSEVEQTDEKMFSVVHSLDKNDTPLVVIEDLFIKKLYALMIHYRRDLERTKADLKFEPENEEMQADFHRLDAKVDMLMDTFWFLVRTKYDIWDGSIGIRKNWQLVRTGKDDNPGREIIQQIFGGE